MTKLSKADREFRRQVRLAAYRFFLRALDLTIAALDDAVKKQKPPAGD